MTSNKIIPYNPKLKALARELRKNSTLSEILLWNEIKKKALGYEFHRQVPINEFIVDFFCHELLLAIEIDGSTHDYNFDYDDFRQTLLQKYGITMIRYSDIDIKRNMNDVLRSLGNIINEMEIIKIEKHPPSPLQRGNYPH
jgi:very-short-patch-repair endonuclease